MRRACTVQPARFLKLCELHQLCLGLHLGALWAHPAGSARVQLSVDDPVAGCKRSGGQPLLPSVHTHQCEQLQCCLSCVYRHTCQQLERPLSQHKAGESVDARVVACACPGTCLRCSHDGALVATCQLDGGGHASPHICLADDGHLPGRVRPAVHSLAHGHSFALSTPSIAGALLLGCKSLTVVGFHFSGWSWIDGTPPSNLACNAAGCSIFTPGDPK